MTKYCEVCHTANRDRARYCTGCAGRFGGVRTSALAAAPLEERQEPTPWATEIAAGRPAEPVGAADARTSREAAARPGAEGPAMDAGVRTFARTAAGTPARRFTHQEAGARTLANASARTFARTPHVATAATAAKVTAQRPSELARVAVAPIPAPAPASGHRPATRNRDALTVVLWGVAFMLTATFAFWEEAMNFDEREQRWPGSATQSAATPPAPRSPRGRPVPWLPAPSHRSAAGRSSALDAGAIERFAACPAHAGAGAGTDCCAGIAACTRGAASCRWPGAATGDDDRSAGASGAGGGKLGAGAGQHDTTSGVDCNSCFGSTGTRRTRRGGHGSGDGATGSTGAEGLAG